MTRALILPTPALPDRLQFIACCGSCGTAAGSVHARVCTRSETIVAIATTLRASAWKTSSARWHALAREIGAALVEAERELSDARAEREQLRGMNESILFENSRARRRILETDRSG